MYEILEGDFAQQKFPEEDYLKNWPMIYILENGKKRTGRLIRPVFYKVRCLSIVISVG